MEGTVNCANLEVLAFVAAGLACMLLDASEAADFKVMGMGDVDGTGTALALESALGLVSTTWGVAFLDDVVEMAWALILTSALLVADLATGLTINLDTAGDAAFADLGAALATLFFATGLLIGLATGLAAGFTIGLLTCFTLFATVLDAALTGVFTGAFALTGAFAVAVNFLVAIFIFLSPSKAGSCITINHSVSAMVAQDKPR